MNHQEKSYKEKNYEEFLEKADELSKIIIQTLAFYPKGVRSINRLIKNIKKLYGDIPIVQKDRKIFYRRIKFLKSKNIKVVEIDEKTNRKYKPIKLNPDMLEYTVYGIMRRWIKLYPSLFKEYINKYPPPLKNYPEEVNMLKLILLSELEYIKNNILGDIYPHGVKEFLISNLLISKDMSIILPDIFKKELINDIISTMYELERIAADKLFEYYKYCEGICDNFFKNTSYPNYIKKKRNDIYSIFLKLLSAELNRMIKNGKEKNETDDNHPEENRKHTLTQEDIKILEEAFKTKFKKKDTLIPLGECTKTLSELIIDSIDTYIEENYKNFNKIYGRLNNIKSNYEVFNKISPEFPEYIYVPSIPI